MSVLKIQESIYGFVMIVSILMFLLAMVLLLRSGKNKSPVDGVLHIDTSNPEFDNYYFELITPLEDLPRKQTVVLKIQVEYSQEK